jgi:hypothetical protein
VFSLRRFFDFPSLGRGTHPIALGVPILFISDFLYKSITYRDWLSSKICIPCKRPYTGSIEKVGVVYITLKFDNESGVFGKVLAATNVVQGLQEKAVVV